jgi:hypothetical protein
MATKKRQGKSGKKPVSKGTAKRPAAQDNQPQWVTVEIIPPTPPSPLRGLLPTPREVKRIAARWMAERPMSESAQKRVIDGLKLQYYFGGWDIAYRQTDQGPEVLAVGKEIGDLFRRLPSDQRRGVIVGHPEPW